MVLGRAKHFAIKLVAIKNSYLMGVIVVGTLDAVVNGERA
jgi:hypothetical protein